jgi:molecular chaperone DnaJ
VPTLRNKAVRGDHYVTLVVQVPTSLNAEQRELLTRFDEAMTGKKGAGTDVNENEKDKEKGKKKFWK